MKNVLLVNLSVAILLLLLFNLFFTYKLHNKLENQICNSEVFSISKPKEGAIAIGYAPVSMKKFFVCSIKDDVDLECPLHGYMSVFLEYVPKNIFLEKDYFDSINIDLYLSGGKLELLFWAQGFYDYGSVIIESPEGKKTEYKLFFDPPVG